MVPSVIRTVVPYVVAALFAIILRWTGIDLSEFAGQSTEMLIVLFAGLWYIVFRWLERNHNAKWGWLLGLADQPLYDEEVEEVVVTSAAPSTLVGRHRA